ncbi:MAG: ComF family protein [Limnohabitans sp.]
MPRCWRCAAPLTAAISGAQTCAQVALCSECTQHPPLLDACWAATSYDWPWADVIASLKFRQQPSWARSMAQLMRSTPWVADALWQADCLLPMPLSRQRLAERGFNQALLLCQCLAPAKTQAHSLLKMRHTPAQSQLKREERLLNLKGALVLDPLRAPALRGKRVILVDDVMTSGATLNTAALVLKQAGAAHVAGLVFARTEAGAHDAPVANSQHNTGYVPYHFG